MSISINKLELENVKRVKALKLTPSPQGLTIIGGNNRQGKTSVLDAIAWGLGGDRYRPLQPQREGSVLPPSIKITLSNGLIVERKGKNSDLKVIDPEGQKGGQQILNEFVEQLAIDLPRFLNSTSKEKAQTLLQIIGVGEKLYELEQKEQSIYNERHAIGQIADRKRKFAEEMTYYPDAPKELLSPSDLIQQQQDILARNGENQRKRLLLHGLQQELSSLQDQIDRLMANKAQVLADLEIAQKSAIDLHDESTAELEANISEIEAINIKVRANLDKEKAEDDAREHSNEYTAMTKQLDEVRKQKIDLLNSASLPLPGLSVDDGDLVYNGYRWGNMSGADQLKVATAIVRKLNPKCGFVLLDKLEQMDADTLREFGEWLEAEGLQAIATRVSTGGECSIIISDGYAVEDGSPQEEQAGTWKAGEF